ncbi:MAG: dihydroorotate dehydrogenase [Firmicutes bacterium]|nr:dihydroorotate dehydrogenase [Bacillota bacterium]
MSCADDSSRRNLQVELAGLVLKNPVMVASGTFDYGREYAEYFDLGILGAVMVKGVSLEPWPGNPPPRIAETPAGMLNAIGLQNPGVDYFITHDLPWLVDQGVTTIVNIVGKTVEEYAAVAARLDQAPGVAALEVNISCPNVKEGGIAFGTDPQMAADVIAAVADSTELPVIAKLSPNVTDITAIAKAVADAGADIISLINTLLGMSIDVDRRKPVLANVMGGLSGPAIRPVAVRMVWQVYQSVDVPIIGMGGIMTTRDALEFILAGATAVAVGTATFRNPTAAVEIIQGLADYCEQHGLSIRRLVGAAHRGLSR